MMNFKFPEKIKINENGEIVEWEELDYDTKWDIINNLSDEVQFFIEEKTDTPEFNENEQGLKQYSNMYEHPVDEIYSIFVEWCKEKGITPISKQTFTEKFGYIYPKKRKRIGGKLTYVFINLILRDGSQVGTPKKIQKDMQDNNSEYMECLFQLMSISIINPPFKKEEKGVILEYDTKLEHQKIPFKVITGLNFGNKGGCSKLKTWSKILEKEGCQGSSQGSSEGIPIEEFSKIEQGSSEEKGEESISDFQTLKDYHYFKSDDYYSDSYFNYFGIQNIEHKHSGDMDYYKIPFSEISKDKYFEFSSRFSSRSEKVFTIDEKEYDSIKGEEEKEK